MHVTDRPPTRPISHTRVFTLPKEGKTVAENEDACACATRPEADIYVVADGASDSVFSGLWAQMLAHRLAHNVPPRNDAPTWRTWIEAVQQEWERTVRADPVPWYVEPKIREGAFATCVALIVQRPTNGSDSARWGAMAVGDTCLFHVQTSDGGISPEASQAARGFPISDPATFGLNPLALSSNSASNEAVWPAVAIAGGVWCPGDSFVLATDALAHWITQEIVPTGAWDRLLSLMQSSDDQAFEALMRAEWERGTLRNDDITLLLVQTGAAP